MSEPLDELAGLSLAPPALSATLEAELATLAPVTPRRPHKQLAILAAVSVGYVGVLLAVLALRADVRGLPVGWLVGAAIAWLAGLAVPCYLALVPRPGAVAPRWRAAAIAAGAVSIGFVGLGLVIHPSAPGQSLDYGSAHFWRGHWCMWLGLATAIVPIVVGAIFLRGALPVRSRWVAAGLGAGAGCLGGLLLHFHCKIADGLHVGLIHGGVVGVAAVLSALLVPRVTDRPLR